MADVTQPQAPETNAERFRRTLRKHWVSYLLLSPAVLFLLVLMWAPFVQGIWMSFHKWPFAGDPTWVGLQNYTSLFAWEAFWTSLRVTALFASTTIIQLAIALPAALIATRLGRFKWLVSGIFLLPYTMPPVITGALWWFLLDPNYGPVFYYLTEFGILQQAVYWSSDATWALGAVIGTTSWTFWPFMFLILVATLDNIPETQYQSARVYGAGVWQQFRRVTLPQIRSAIIIVISLRFIWNMSKVSQIFQMTDGGPGYATSILAVLLYRQGLTGGNLGAAFTIGLVLFALILVFVLMFIREFERSTTEVGEK